jgi:hypothetical protein
MLVTFNQRSGPAGLQDKKVVAGLSMTKFSVEPLINNVRGEILCATISRYG